MAVVSTTLSGSNGWASPDLPASDILNFICKWQQGCSLWLPVYCSNLLSCPRFRGAFWNSAIRPSICPIVQLPCLGYRHAGCLQLSHRQPPEMCGLWTRLWTDVDPPQFLDQTAIGGGILSRRPWLIPCYSHID